MIPLWLALGACIISSVAGYYLRKTEEETCPRQVYGYSCKGYVCDHSEAMLRRAQLDMALMRENEEDSKPANYNFKP